MYKIIIRHNLSFGEHPVAHHYSQKIRFEHFFRYYVKKLAATGVQIEGYVRVQGNWRLCAVVRPLYILTSAEFTNLTAEELNLLVDGQHSIASDKH